MGQKCSWCWFKAVGAHSCFVAHLLGFAPPNRSHEVDVWRYYYCSKRMQQKKNPKAKRLWWSQSKKDERKKKREDERLVFSKPRWFVMLEVWNISLRPPAALQDCELLQHKPACSSSPPLWRTVENQHFLHIQLVVGGEWVGGGGGFEQSKSRLGTANISTLKGEWNYYRKVQFKTDVFKLRVRS